MSTIEVSVSAGQAFRREAAGLAAKAAEWDAAEADATARAAQLESESGQRVLEDPSSMAAVADQIERARTEARLAGAAAERAREGAHAAAVQAWRADAAALEPQIEAERRRVAEHQAKVDQLLGELVAFSNADWRMVTVADPEIQDRVARGERVELRHPLVFALTEKVEELERERDRLLANAEKQAKSAEWAPESSEPTDWHALAETAKAAAADAEEVLARAEARLESASPMQRGAAIEAHRRAKSRRDWAAAEMHTAVERERAFAGVVA